MSIKRSVDYMSDIAEQAQREHDEAIAAKKKIDNRINGVIDAIESYGYRVDIEPMGGFEETFLETLEGALARIEDTMNIVVQSQNRVRNGSLTALQSLHEFEPEPQWGIVADEGSE